MLAAVKQDGRLLKYAAKSLQADREVVLEAVKQDGEAIRHAAEELQNNPELQRIAESYNNLKELAREWMKKRPK